MQKKFKVIIAGGGTGGHLYPAIALVKEIEKRFPQSEILFIGTSRGIEAKIIPEMKYQLKLIWIKGFQRKLSLGNLILPLQVIISFFQCAITILNFRPNVVIGTGGYVSGPAILIASFLKVPTIVQEQNSVPGITTRFLASFADQVHLSFDESKKYFTFLKNRDKVFVSGNPIRNRLRTISRDAAISKLNIDATKKTLLITGGSQGAHSINEAIQKIIDRLMKMQDWQIIWGTGEKDFDAIRSACKKYSSRIIVKPYITDIASAYAVTDLIINRAGATMLAELKVCGLPTILVPYPFAAAGHQEANARALMEQKAVEMVLNSELESDKFLNTIVTLMENETKRTTLGSNLKALAKPDAAKIIIDEMVKLIDVKVN